MLPLSSIRIASHLIPHSSCSPAQFSTSLAPACLFPLTRQARSPLCERLRIREAFGRRREFGRSRRAFGTTTPRGLISSAQIAMANNPTLVKPPPLDPSKSAIENVLELTELAAIGPSLYTNTRPLWHPPGARGIYGGAVIAQCLSAAQLTVPPTFTVHSMHCYFVLAGDSLLPIIYHVEHVRDGKSFATRTVQARQRGRPIFTTTMSFVREESGGVKKVEHSTPLPEGMKGTMPGVGWGDVGEGGLGDVGGEAGDSDTASSGSSSGSQERGKGSGREDFEEWSPFVSKRLEVLNSSSDQAHTKRTRQWMRCRGRISPAGGHAAHLSALAYMSDSYFIGTVSRIHDLSRIDPNAKPKPKPKPAGPSLSASSPADVPREAVANPQISMMVSLDHTIFFHSPRAFRADEWMFTECESPWSGDGRGVVVQKMWGSDGRLVATCFQEGVVRLRQDEEGKSKL